MALMKITELTNVVYDFCAMYSGIKLFLYQEQFSKRLIRSLLENDGEELTALFSRQIGKSETVAVTVGGVMIFLPYLATLPMFKEDKRIMRFEDGVWVGIFAPSLRQSQITFNRIRARLQSKTCKKILQDPESNLYFTTSNGQTCSLSNGSWATSLSASENSNIEGESLKLIIIEEAQDVSDFKIKKCLTYDTRILMSNGEYLDIETLVKQKKGEVVLFNSSMNYLTSKTPVEFYDNGKQEVYKLKLNNGDTIEATLNHQFYTYSKNTKKGGPKFRTVKDIIDSFDKYSSLRIGVPDILPYFAQEQENDYEKGLILGYFLGDGCLVGTPHFIGDLSTNKRLIEIIKKVFGENVYMTECNYNPSNGMQEVCFSTPTNCKNSNPLTVWFREIGMHNVTGVNKCLPDKLYSKSFYTGVIEGLIATDGCVADCYTKPHISFANISEKLVKQLKDVYLKFGIHTTMFSRENNKGLSINAKIIHIITLKSVLDLNRFGNNIKLFKKQHLLDEALNKIQNRVTRNKSKHYSNNIRFYKVTSCVSSGVKHTYCLKTEGRNFIANNMISSNSIMPMGAFYNASIAKIGTSSTYKGDFFNSIDRNKKFFDNGQLHLKNHYEFDYKIGCKYNPSYAKYIEGEKFRYGEHSDEFRMSYKLEWLFERGSFIDDVLRYERDNGDPTKELEEYNRLNSHVVGIDVAAKTDSTIITVVKVDWDNPVIDEGRYNEETNEMEIFKAYYTDIVCWKEIFGEDYEAQYHICMDFFKNFNIVRLVIDSTKEASLADRFKANVPFEVIPFVFSTQSKSDMYKYLDGEIKSKRSMFPRGEMTVRTREYTQFLSQMGDLQKNYKGAVMQVCHPPNRGAHDDYPDSYALAVYGTKDQTDTVVVETEKENIIMKKKQSRFYTSRNKITAKRR